MGHAKHHREGVVCGLAWGVQDGARQCEPRHEMKEEEMMGLEVDDLIRQYDACLV